MENILLLEAPGHLSINLSTISAYCFLAWLCCADSSPYLHDAVSVS